MRTVTINTWAPKACSTRRHELSIKACSYVFSQNIVPRMGKWVAFRDGADRRTSSLTVMC